MNLLLAFSATALAFALAKNLAILLVDALATLIAAYYHWRRDRLFRAISAAATPRRSRRLLARHLHLSIAMTELYSLFPRSAERGYALAQVRIRR